MTPDDKQKLRELAEAVGPLCDGSANTVLALLDENRCLESELRHEQRQIKTKTMLMNKAYAHVQKLEAALKILRDNRMHDSHVTKIAREALRQEDE